MVLQVSSPGNLGAPSVSLIANSSSFTSPVTSPEAHRPVNRAPSADHLKSHKVKASKVLHLLGGGCCLLSQLWQHLAFTTYL